MKDRELLQKMLARSGLSAHESAVYLAMLELGPSTVLKAARQSGVKRTTIYGVIESLQSKGLVSVEEPGFKKLYVAEDPLRLKRLIEEQQHTLEAFFPELEALYSVQGNDSVLRYHVGAEAMRAVYDELLGELRSRDEYFVYGDPERWDQFDKQYFKTFIKRRLRINLDAKVALVPSELARSYKENEQNFREEVRLLPEGTGLDANMVITARKVIIHPLTHPITTIVIETPALVHMHQSLFRVIWASLASH
jgi:sugar-specific transcriptional regulator TrmB